MCWAPLALGVASTAASFAQQTEASKRQNEAYVSNANAANTNAVEQYYQNNLSFIQEEAKAVQERMKTKEEVIRAKGTAVASSQNSGQSMSNVLNNLERQGAKADNVTDINIKNTKTNAVNTAKSIESQTKGRIDSVSQGAEPDLVATAISGLGPTLVADIDSKYEKQPIDHKEKVTI